MFNVNGFVFDNICPDWCTQIANQREEMCNFSISFFV